MIITCTNCSMRLQVDDEKVPARPFTLRCPKCQNIVHAQPPAPVSQEEQGAFDVAQSPASGQTRLETPQPASPDSLASSAAKESALTEKENVVKEPSSTETKESSSTETKDLMRMLATLLQRGTQGVDSSRPGLRLEWEARHVLVCIGEAQREAVTRALAESDYQIYVAENKAQAFERMRDERIDIIILSADFDQVEQGAAFVTREVNTLRPAERRRLFLVHLSDTGRTSDAHAAFINNVSLIVNREDVGKMPRAIERALRDYNELYRCYNDALGVRAI